jgi:hypothetical protein
MGLAWTFSLNDLEPALSGTGRTQRKFDASEIVVRVQSQQLHSCAGFKRSTGKAGSSYVPLPLMFFRGLE